MCQLLFTYPDLAIPKDTKDVLFANPISEVDTGNTNSIKELELRNKDVWNRCVKNNMLMLLVYDKEKLASSAEPEDALIERYYFSYIQLEQLNWVVNVK